MKFHMYIYPSNQRPYHPRLDFLKHWFNDEKGLSFLLGFPISRWYTIASLFFSFLSYDTKIKKPPESERVSAFICIPLERSNGGKKKKALLLASSSSPEVWGWIDALDRSSKERETWNGISSYHFEWSRCSVTRFSNRLVIFLRWTVVLST